MKERIQAGFESNEESLELFGKTYSTQLKAYLIESNHRTPKPVGCPKGKWRKLDSTGWYVNKTGKLQDYFYLDATRKRVWIVYSIMDARESDLIIDKWIRSRKGLDNCWLSRKQLLHWSDLDAWSQRGLGLRFSDGLSPEDEQGHFSLKAWHGAKNYFENIQINCG